RDAAYAGTSGHRKGREAREIDQHDLCGLLDAKPDHDQRQISERRQWTIELDRRIEDAPRDSLHLHRDADRNCGDARENERREEAIEAAPEMLGLWPASLDVALLRVAVARH